MPLEIKTCRKEHIQMQEASSIVCTTPQNRRRTQFRPTANLRNGPQGESFSPHPFDLPTNQHSVVLPKWIVVFPAPFQLQILHSCASLQSIGHRTHRRQPCRSIVDSLFRGDSDLTVPLLPSSSKFPVPNTTQGKCKLLVITWAT